jgi:hypothetical protein
METENDRDAVNGGSVRQPEPEAKRLHPYWIGGAEDHDGPGKFTEHPKWARGWPGGIGKEEPDEFTQMSEPILKFEGEITESSESIRFHFRGDFPQGRDALRRAIATMQRRFDEQRKCPFHEPETSK